MGFMESRTIPDAGKLSRLNEAQWQMRLQLIEFLIQIHVEFQLPPEALFLSVNLLDRYCCVELVPRNKFQLVGCTALLIAAKYGDSRKGYTPSLEELSSACCFAYETWMFAEMEWRVLGALEWVIGHPDTCTFIRLALTESRYDPELRCLSTYIAEIAFFYREIACTKPSVLSRAAVALAHHILARRVSDLPSCATFYD
ncbi:cyclin-like protein, partial [Phaeosphaeriaceae sp. PMI808]